MCGIAGVVTWDERYRITRATLATMSAKIAHRGPDGEGFFLTREHEPITPDTPQAGFAFRRLAILDPDPRSMQPFTIGQQTLVFNGEIYNFRELRAELSKLRPDYQWRTTGDTEVLLMSYQVWAEKCVEHLNGMFAFAVWDEREKTLFLARDRMGQKPLYVAEETGVIAFASEVAALRANSWIDWNISADGLSSFLTHGFVDRIYEGCWQLSFGWTQTVTSKKPPLICRYFHPEISNLSAEQRGDPAGTRGQIQRAVERQLVSDVPLGVFLSGGIDSSVIALAARRYGPVKTFSIGFDDPRYDERPYAEQVAAHAGTEHQSFCVTPHAAEDLLRLSQVFGEPFADSSALPTSYLARETRQHVKVALSGDGGDELFGGYDRYRAIRAGRAVRALAPLAPFGRRLAHGHPKSTLARAGRLMASSGLSLPRRYQSYLQLFDDQTIDQLCERRCQTYPDVAAIFKIEQNRCGDAVRAALATDRAFYLPLDLLTKVDRCSMLHGLEVRSPFMDHELVQFAAGLTTDQLLKGGPKRMLREAFAKDLPDFVFKRKKMGFAVPIGEWFRDDPSLRAMLHETLFARDAFGATHFNMTVVRRLVNEHMSSRVDHSQRLYALLMLELWWNTQK